MPNRALFQPPVKVWSGESTVPFSSRRGLPANSGRVALPELIGGSSADLGRASSLLLILGVLGGLAGTFAIARDVRSLMQIRRSSFAIRKIGQVSIYSHDEISIPIAYWLPFRADVVLPNALLAKSADCRMAIAHELQHHRQADTRWAYAIWALRVACAPNPAVHLWSGWLSELQEFACDEALVDRGKVESRQYARCLVEAAQTALNQRRVPACATGLASGDTGKMLTRRIEKMLKDKRKKVNSRAIWPVAGIAILLMAGTAFAFKGIARDHRISLADAQAMVRAGTDAGDFPVVVNDLVLAELNRYVGTPEGREYARAALRRMEGERAMIEAKAKEYDVPSDLMAIPIVESGYRNLPQAQNKAWGAGYWMFVEATARKYGLRVDSQVDERLSGPLETDAAMRYLKSNRLLFKDWLLAALAYNMGEAALQKAIDDTGSRDPWTLIRKGYEGDKGYLARVEAAVLILRNPESVR
jgi:hypothetical protein